MRRSSHLSNGATPERDGSPERNHRQHEKAGCFGIVNAAIGAGEWHRKRTVVTAAWTSYDAIPLRARPDGAVEWSRTTDPLITNQLLKKVTGGSNRGSQKRDAVSMRIS